MYELAIHKTTSFGLSWWVCEVSSFGEQVKTVYALTETAIKRKGDRVCFKSTARALGISVRNAKKFQWITEKKDGNEG